MYFYSVLLLFVLYETIFCSVSTFIPATSTLSGFSAIASQTKKYSFLINFWDQELTSFKSKTGKIKTEGIVSGREVAGTGMAVKKVGDNYNVAIAREFDGLVQLITVDESDNVQSSVTLNSGAPLPCLFCLFAGQPLDCGACESTTLPGLFGINDLNYNAAGELYGGTVFQDGIVWKIDENPAVFPTVINVQNANPSSSFKFNETRIRGVAFCADSNDTMYAVVHDDSDAGTEAGIITIDLNTGDASYLNNADMGAGTNGFLFSLECDANGILYTVDRRRAQIYSVDTSNGNVGLIDGALGVESGITIMRNCWDENCKVGDNTEILVQTGLVEINRIKIENENIFEVINAFAAGLGAISYIKESNGDEFIYLSNLRSIIQVDVNENFGNNDFLISNERITGVDGRPSGNTVVVSVSEDYILSSDYVESTRLQVIDREDFLVEREYGSFFNPVFGPLGSIELEDGTILLCQFTENPSYSSDYHGNLLSLQNAPDPFNPFIPDFRITKILDNVTGPVGIVQKDSSHVYISVTNYPSRDAGEIWEVDIVAKTSSVVCSGLDLPEGIDLLSDGRIIIANAGAKSLVTCNPNSGVLVTIDSNLKMNKQGVQTAVTGPWIRDIGFFNGVAVDDDNNVYVVNDVDNSVEKYSNI